ncbi:MAG: hypothetical protein AAFU61_02435 [Pseudomonadota bacterium]
MSTPDLALDQAADGAVVRLAGRYVTAALGAAEKHAARIAPGRGPEAGP